MNPAIFGTHRGQRNRLHHAKRQKRARCDRTSRVPCLAFADTRARRAFSGRIGEHEDPRFPASTERTESSRRPTRERNRHSARVVDSLRFLDLSLLRSFGTMHLSIRFFLSGPRSLTRPFSFSLRPGRPQSRPGFFCRDCQGATSTKSASLFLTRFQLIGELPSVVPHAGQEPLRAATLAL